MTARRFNGPNRSSGAEVTGICRVTPFSVFLSESNRVKTYNITYIYYFFLEINARGNSTKLQIDEFYG